MNYFACMVRFTYQSHRISAHVLQAVEIAQNEEISQSIGFPYSSYVTPGELIRDG
jgi:hypothetical protein